MSKIRVLLVDDAIVVRRLLTDIIGEDPGMEVCGVAPNGRIALQKLPQLAPDLVVLDVEMPEMNGLETLRELRKQWPRLPVIMFSTLTERGAATTLEALSLGATDYITKPSNQAGILDAKQRVRDDLLPKIRLFTGRAKGTAATPAPAAPAPGLPARAVAPALGRLPVPVAKPRTAPPAAPEVLAIGVSTGGPNALAELIPALPAGFPLPVLLVQHMPPLFTRFLAERLAAKAKLPVVEAKDGQPIEGGTVYIAPGDYHLVAERQGGRIVARLNQQPPENSCRPAVDPLFRSVVQVWGAHVLGVVLTGMGQDGCRGAEKVREAGGAVLAQDEASSVVWGMPGFVVQCGLADKVLPLAEMAAEITRRCARPVRVG